MKTKSKKTDLTNLKIIIEDVVYTASLNKRYSDYEYWTILRNGKKFGHVSYEDKHGWISTFATTGLSNNMWMFPKDPKTPIEKKIHSMHEADKDFRDKIIKIHLSK